MSWRASARHAGSDAGLRLPDADSALGALPAAEGVGAGMAIGSGPAGPLGGEWGGEAKARNRSGSRFYGVDFGFCDG